MKMRIRAHLLRRLLGLTSPMDVAIVSVIGHEAVITRGTWYRKQPVTMTSVSEWTTSEWMH